MSKIFELRKNAGVKGAPVMKLDDDVVCVPNKDGVPILDVCYMLHDMADEDLSPSQIAKECGIDELQIREVIRWLARIVDGMEVVETE